MISCSLAARSPRSTRLASAISSAAVSSGGGPPRPGTGRARRRRSGRARRWRTASTRAGRPQSSSTSTPRAASWSRRASSAIRVERQLLGELLDLGLLQPAFAAHRARRVRRRGRVGIWRGALDHVFTIVERRRDFIRSGPGSDPGDYGSPSVVSRTGLSADRASSIAHAGREPVHVGAEHVRAVGAILLFGLVAGVAGAAPAAGAALDGGAQPSPAPAARASRSMSTSGLGARPQWRSNATACRSSRRDRRGRWHAPERVSPADAWSPGHRASAWPGRADVVVA